MVSDSSHDVALESTVSLSGPLHPPKATSENPPLGVPIDDLLGEDAWLAHRGLALTPLDVSDLVTSEQTRRELIEGARLLGKDVLYPHQLVIADALNAGHETNAVLQPRQSAKTTTLLMLVLGRCALRARYNAAMTLTTQATKTFEVFEQTVIDELEFAYPDEGDRPFRVYKGKGSQHVRFPNGSRFSAKSPKGPSFRASSYDLVWIDEAGEATPEQGTELLDAIMSTFDTRPGAQLVLTGTAGMYRRGLLLWDGLESPENGRVRYAMPDSTTEDELASWEPTEEHPHGRVRELTIAMHPGIAVGLTTEDTVRRRYERPDNTPERYAREYGGIFGNMGEGLGVFDPKVFAETGEDGTPDVPEHFAIAIHAAFNQGKASMVAAWRDDKGRACGFVLDHRDGTTWLAESAFAKAKQHRAPIVYDMASSTVRVEVEAIQRMRPRPRLEPQKTADVTAAANLLVKEVNAGHARHWHQPALTKAVGKAVRRTVSANAWALGRPAKDPNADISAAEAWAMALRFYDENPTRNRVRPAVAA